MEHLYFTKVDKPPQDRRKKKGFVPRGDRKSNIQHPLLKDAIGDSKTFYVTDGYTANENDIAGHGTMVAGICEYGIIHPEDTFVPRIYLYSAKIHDGEYIGDFALCKQELDDEKIEINMEQEEILYNYFSGKITQEQLFEKLELKTRVPETKSIIKKYTHMHEKLIVNQMREIVAYFNSNYGCRIFNLSQGDLNYPWKRVFKSKSN